jgi:hypothetical protein
MSPSFDIKTAKRYFHMVAFKFDSKFNLRNYWRDCSFEMDGNSTVVHDSGKIRLEKHSIISDIQYYFGETDYSLNGENEAPYRYDLIAVELKEYNIFIFGYPFKLLAKDIIKRLIEDKRYKAKGSFLKPNLDQLIKLTNSQDFGNEDATCYFSSLSMILTGDTKISSIDLEGDKPLESSLYRRNFKKMIDEDFSKVEKGIIKCEIETELPDGIPKTRSNIHLDHYGNFKMYVHGTGKNVYTVPFLLTILSDFDCLQATLTNPLINLNDEQL